MDFIASLSFLYSASLSFKMFIGPAAAARWALQNRVSPSFSLSGCFLGTGIGARNPNDVVCDRNRFFEKKLLSPETLGKWIKVGPKIEVFLNLLKK